MTHQHGAVSAAFTAPQPVFCNVGPALSGLSAETLASTSTSITIIGDDTELNWAVCQALAKKIGWFPVSTAKILTGMNKAGSIQEIVDKQGREALGELFCTHLKP
jgi:hypothetical protein